MASEDSKNRASISLKHGEETIAVWYDVVVPLEISNVELPLTAEQESKVDALRGGAEMHIEIMCDSTVRVFDWNIRKEDRAEKDNIK